MSAGHEEVHDGRHYQVCTERIGWRESLTNSRYGDKVIGVPLLYNVYKGEDALNI